MKIPQDILDDLRMAFQALGNAIQSRYSKPKNMPLEQQNPPPQQPSSAPLGPSVDTIQPWTSPANNRHNVRVLCDFALLTLTQKNIITACVEVESGFYNYYPSGQPVIHKNTDDKGNLLSTDWGIVQINDHYHIGQGKDFPSVDFVMQNPDKAVQFMIDMYKVGRLSMWVSYSSGAYLRYMPVA